MVYRERDRVNAVIAEARDDTKAHSEAGAKGKGDVREGGGISIDKAR